MSTVVIDRVTARDTRFALSPGAGADAMHSDPVYAFAVTRLETSGFTGTGLALTLGGGNDLVCSAIALLATALVGREIEELMADFGVVSRSLADHPQLRWLGPHKGVVHLALASITNACFDLWAKARGVPLWRLLLDLSPDQLVATLDLSGLEDVLTAEQARDILARDEPSRGDREDVLAAGYPGYDTSVGWFQYSDGQLAENVTRALGNGCLALKLKVGSDDLTRDVRRANLLRELAGPAIPVMLDANQRWSLPEAIAAGRALAAAAPFWIEEPLHPDDLIAHRTLAREIAPVPIALGEHAPNRIVFKNYLQLDAVRFVQVDCTRVAGVSEFLTVSLLAKMFARPIVPHVGDMGQIHQHLVLFNRIALAHEQVFLEHIPHLREHFVHPARIEAGRYVTPEEAGASSDLRDP